MELLNIKNLSFTYPLCSAPAVSDVNLSVERGEIAVLCGATGSGKSTLARLCKRELIPRGDISGDVLFCGKKVLEMSAAESARSIGFVMQDTERQIVTDKVWHELAFGLENLGVDKEQIARRVAEIASYFGIEHWYDKQVSELSGGQRQLLNLASVMITDPKLLILDEPTSQLDPIATADFLSTLKRLNSDFSLTILIVEHRLEELVPMCDRLLIMDDGQMVANGVPRDIISSISQNNDIFHSLPVATRLYHSLKATGECPLTQIEGRALVEKYGNAVREIKRDKYTHSDRKALELKCVYYRYSRELPDALSALDLTVYENEIFCILGGNGSGKTTALGVASGIKRNYAGSVKIFEKKIKEYKGQELWRGTVAVLPQDVQTLFLKNTVREELEDAKADVEKLPFDLSALYEKHPYDLSGGQQQLVALAKVLATAPRLLLLDEPTKALDAAKKLALAEVVKQLKSRGMTVVIVTHDVEFCSMCADRCALFFRGHAVSEGTVEEFFGENTFYTTAASRMSRGYYDRAVTVESIAELCRKNEALGGLGDE